MFFFSYRLYAFSFHLSMQKLAHCPNKCSYNGFNSHNIPVRQEWQQRRDWGPEELLCPQSEICVRNRNWPYSSTMDLAPEPVVFFSIMQDLTTVGIGLLLNTDQNVRFLHCHPKCSLCLSQASWITDCLFLRNCDLPWQLCSAVTMTVTFAGTQKN